MAAEFRIYIDGAPASDDLLDRFSEITVDQAIDMVTEARLQLDIGVDDGGNWSDVDADWAAPFTRVRIEVRIDDGDFTPLIEGSVVEQRFELDGAPNRSSMTVIVHDDSALMNREETVAVFEDMTASDIATQLYQEFGLTPEVDAVDRPDSQLELATVQRGTAIGLLRGLGRRYGLNVYVKPGDAPGETIGVFARPDLAAGDHPELLLLGADRNLNRFSAHYDATRAQRVSAASVSAVDIAVIEADAESASLDDLGDTPAHAVADTGVSLLSRTNPELDSLDANVQAGVDASSWAYQAEAELGQNYPDVLSPYEIVTVAGAGPHLSGQYLVSHVMHTLSDQGYRQTLGLRRNARSEGGGASDLLAGVF